MGVVNTKRVIFVVLNLLLLLVSGFVEPRAISNQVQYHRIDFMSWSLVCPIISRSEGTEVDVRQRVMFLQLLMAF
jgi:hypothetical protein